MSSRRWPGRARPCATPRWRRRRSPHRCARCCCRGSSTPWPSRATSSWCSTTSTACRAPRRGRASPGSSITCRPRRRSCSPRGPTPPYRSVRCAPAGTCSSCGPTTCASPCPRPRSSSTAGSRSGCAPRRSRRWWRAPRAGPPRSTSPRSRWRARRTRRGWSGPSTARARTSSSSSRARCSRRSTRRCRSSCCGPRRSNGCARTCATPCWGSPVPRRPSRSWPAATSSCSRWTTAASGSASTTCSPSCCGWSSAAASRNWFPSCTVAPPRGTPPRVRRTRRSTMRSPPVRTPTPRRSSPGPGCTTSTRAGPAPSSTGWPGSRARSSTATRGCCSCRRGPRHCGAGSTTCVARSPSPRSAATSRTGRCRTGSRRSPRASACCGPRSAGATSA